MKFLKLVALPVLMALFLTGCPCTFPRHVLVNENLVAENSNDETVVFYSDICEDPECKNKKLVEDWTSVRYDAGKRQVSFAKSRFHKCDINEDHDELVWFQNGSVVKKLKVVCDSTDKEVYHAYLYDAYGSVKTFRVANDGGLVVNLSEQAGVPQDEKFDIMVAGILPETILLKNFQIIPFRNTGDNRQAVPYKVNLQTGCSTCGGEYKRDRYELLLDYATGVNEILLLHEGNIIQTVSVVYSDDGKNLVDVKASLSNGQVFQGNSSELGYWKVQILSN